MTNNRSIHGPSCKMNKDLQIKTDNADVNDVNANGPDYFWSSINRATGKEQVRY